MTTFATPSTAPIEAPRDRWLRPLIVPPGGGRRVPYTRVSTFAKSLDDTNGLVRWASAMTLIGAARDGGIVERATGLDYDADKPQLMGLVDEAQILGGSKDKAAEGTRLHQLTELIDTGAELPADLDAQTLADLDAYRQVTSSLRSLLVESFVVCDELRVAGTFDRLVQVADDECVPPWLRGRTCIADLKTGSLDYAVGGFAVQIALYSRGELYDPGSTTRTPLDADQDVGLVIHLPQKQGRAALYAVNLNAGWRGAQLAAEVRAWRAEAKLSNRNFESKIARHITGARSSQRKGTA